MDRQTWGYTKFAKQRCFEQGFDVELLPEHSQKLLILYSDGC